MPRKNTKPRKPSKKGPTRPKAPPFGSWVEICLSGCCPPRTYRHA